ncbi:TetR family transcriptional regulator C-terminal domain-containing protein [Amycolatopsis lexingtonensis]|uniref:TetR family transcriptional regulator C-terminal domain-containing protein n=1 Tax=Amycolatopsis lexingtonensis TaxID=218822 RepID=UPI000A39E1B5
MHTERGAIGGCPLGSLTAQLAEEDPEARRLIEAGFHQWTGYLARGLSRMRENGHLLPDTDPTALAENILTIVQGGFVLMQASRSIRRLSDALDLALRVLAAAMPPA